MNSSGDDGVSKPQKAETTLVTAGRDTKAQKGFVNPPVVHGSTVLYPTADDLHAHRGEFQYGRRGTPTTKALQEALMALEGPQCAGVGIAPSGLAAITTTLLAVLKAGDHLLVCDNAYRPTRNFCNGLLARYGVETSYFDPLIGAGIAGLFKPNTKAVLVEAPGSQSFEMPDIPAIASVAHARGALVIDDNTWATPLFHRSLEQGVDISMQAATKYIGGHSDIMFGTISANAKAWPLVAEAIQQLGVCAGPDDVFLAIRGLRTLAVRLAQHHRSGLEMARWLAARPEVARVLHPALESDPGHAIWKRDFTGASGLFSIVLEAGAATGRRCPARHRRTVRHGLFVGRLREPGHSVRLRRLSHGHQMGAGRPDLETPYRAGECRGPQGRPCARLRGLQRGARRQHVRRAPARVSLLKSHLPKSPFAIDGARPPPR